MIKRILKKLYFWSNGRILRKNKVQYGKNIILNGKPIVQTRADTRQGDISIGDNCTFNSNSRRFNPLGYAMPCIFRVAYGGKIKIGNYVGMSNCVIAASKSTVTIGDYATIGGGVTVVTTDFHPLDPELRKGGNWDKSNSAPVVIGENAFIGMGSIILKGVTIGKNAIIGAGSVVCKDVGENEVWGGNPARFIKKIY